jgi:hypothetical protein
MMLHGMEGWFDNNWHLDGKRPTNSAQKARKLQSERDKQANKKKKSTNKR